MAAPKSKAAAPSQPKPYQVVMSLRFVAGTVVVFAALAFSTGRVLCTILANQQRLQGQLLSAAAGSAALSASSGVLPAADDQSNNLSPPLVKGEKTVPVTIYTSKHFDTAKAKSTASLFLQSDQIATKKTAMTEPLVDPTESVSTKHVKSEETTATAPPTVIASSTHDNATNFLVDAEDDDDEEHLPAGQHLLADIDNVEMAFLDSKKRLADAMVELVYECGLTMLSYHCHRLTPSGVSCAGVLLESHVSFHTWPEAGVITLDLFTCGSTSLLPIVPMVEKLFALQRENTSTPPRLVWSYKRRGFAGFSNINNDNTDFFSYPVGIHGMEEKKEIAAFETDKEQTRVRIYDVLHQNKQDDVDRQIYINGRLKYQTSLQAPSQESMIHPAMITHATDPKRILIVGGIIEGGMLREIFKYQSIESVVVLESDPEIVHLAKSPQLAKWNDCSEIVGTTTTSNCLDDPRIELYYHNNNPIMEWFQHTTIDKFDVIFWNHEPQLQDPNHFISNALTSNGIMVMHLYPSNKDGVSDSQRSQKHSSHKNHQEMKSLFVDHFGFADSHYYEEIHGEYVNPKSYIIAFKSNETNTNWYRNEAQINLELMKRNLQLQYFDGTTMKTYQDATIPKGEEWKRPNIPIPKTSTDMYDDATKKQENNSNDNESCENPVPSV